MQWHLDMSDAFCGEIRTAYVSTFANRDARYAAEHFGLYAMQALIPYSHDQLTCMLSDLYETTSLR